MGDHSNQRETEIRSASETPSSPNLAEPISSMFEAAPRYAQLGYTVFPAVPGEKKSFKSAEYSKDGERWGATNNIAQVRLDFRKRWPSLADGQSPNIGLPTGIKNKVFIADADTIAGHGKDGVGNLKAFIAEHGFEWPDTLTAISPTGGLHYYFNYPTGVVIRNRQNKPVDGVDICGEGGMVVVPPSIKPGVGPYRWLNAGQPIADPPQWLIDRVKAEEHERPAIIDDEEIDIDKVIFALDAATNADVDETTWYHIMAAAHNGSGGDQRAYDAFERWSGKSEKKHEEKRTKERWKAFTKNPSREIKVGTLYWHADETAPGWRDDYMNKVLRDLQVKMQAAARDAARRRDEPSPEPKPEAAKSTPANDDEPPPEPPPKPKPKGIHATPFVWIDPSKIPMREWLYKPYYVRQTVSATISTGGIGKSYLLIAESLAMVSNQDLLGVQPDEQLRVWYWNGEEPELELQRRFGAAIKHYGLTPDDLGARLFMDSGSSMPIVIAEDTKNGIKIAVPVVEGVVATLVENKIDVLIIDPFITCHHVPENDNNAIDQVVRTWMHIAKIANCAIMLAHHTRKPMQGTNGVSTDDGRGASSFRDAVRLSRALNNMTKEEAENARIDPKLKNYYFRADKGKANLLPPAEHADWYQFMSVDIGNNPLRAAPGDNMGVVAAWDFTINPTIVTVDHIRRAQALINEGGPWRKDQRAKPWIGDPIAKAFGLNIDNKRDRTQLITRIEQWIKGGLLVVENRRDPSLRSRDPVDFISAGREPRAEDADAGEF
ncbi:AAA family ATPase [Bradyrhizobium sp. UFLA05-153]